MTATDHPPGYCTITGHRLTPRAAKPIHVVTVLTMDRLPLEVSIAPDGSVALVVTHFGRDQHITRLDRYQALALSAALADCRA